MSHKLGVYYGHHHDWASSWDYMRRLQPPVIRILMPGDTPTELVSRVHQSSVNSVIALRWWDVDDGGEGNKRAKLAHPEASAEQDGKTYLARIEAMEQDAKRKGIPFPPRRQLRVNTLNEPPTWEHDKRPAVVKYGVVLTLMLKPHRIPVYSGCLAVGHPEEWPPVWEWAQPLADAIKLSPGSALELHEYWQLEGPDHVWGDGTRKDWGALAGRYRHCPFNVPIIIGECGADGRLYDRRPNHTGWVGNMSPETYAGQLGWYLERINQDSRIIAALPFLTDYQADEWGTFDTTGAHEAILQMVDRVHLPIVSGPDVPPERPTAPPAANDNWERAIAWVLKWEGGFQANPADVGNYYQGQLIGTKYGISAASWGHLYDIPNLTLDQAKAIYREHYWQASGADRLQWPLALLVMDTAVLHGTGTAQAWLREVGPNPYKFAAKRLRVYTKLPNWNEFGAGWVNRTADLLAEMG